MRISWRKYKRHDTRVCAACSHIFLLSAVMSLETLIIRSRRSWCSSSSLRKVSNIDMKGDAAGAATCFPLVSSCLASVIFDQLIMFEGITLVKVHITSSGPSDGTVF